MILMAFLTASLNFFFSSFLPSFFSSAFRFRKLNFSANRAFFAAFAAYKLRD